MWEWKHTCFSYLCSWFSWGGAWGHRGQTVLSASFLFHTLRISFPYAKTLLRLPEGPSIVESQKAAAFCCIHAGCRAAPLLQKLLTNYCTKNKECLKNLKLMWVCSEIVVHAWRFWKRTEKKNIAFTAVLKSSGFCFAFHRRRRVVVISVPRSRSYTPSRHKTTESRWGKVGKHILH